MSLEIEDTLEAVRKASIPLPWLLQVNLKKKSKLSKISCSISINLLELLLLQGYPSDRSLPSYIKNLAQRVEFFNGWIEVDFKR